MQIQKKTPSLIYFMIFLAIFCLVLVVIPSDGQGAELKSKTMGFKEVLNFALENASELKITQHKKEIANADLDKSTASFMPSLEVSAGQGLEMQKVPGSDDYNTSSPSSPWTSQLSLTGKQNIYNNGEDKINYDISKRKNEIAKIEEESTRDDLLFKIIQNYFQYSLLKKSFEIKNMMNDLLVKQFNLVTNQYKQGHKTKIDYLRFKAKVEQGNLDLLTYASDLKNLEINLKKEMGMDLNEAITFLPLSEKELSYSELENSNEITFDDLRIGKMANERTLISNLESDLVHKKKFPNLSLESNLNYGVPDYLSSNRTFSKNYGINFNVMLKVTYQLFDGGRTTNEILAQKHQESLVKLDYVEKKREWEEKRLNLNENLKKLKENVKLHQELTKLEELSFKTVEEDYRMGKVAFLDYVSALTNFTDSKLNLIKNNFELNKTLIEDFYQRGNLYEVLFKN